MQTDEQQIRQLISDWMAATKSRDADKILSLIADDAIFLVTGQPVMNKKDFAEISQQQASKNAPDIDGTSEIQEIKIIGEWAFIWTTLSVTITPTDGFASTVRAGHTLSILKKENGKWLLTRDANLLASVPQPTLQ